MKALSLTQPWATLVAIGAKRIETRSWSTRHRGLIAIHASKGFPKDCQEICNGSPFVRALAEGRSSAVYRSSPPEHWYHFSTPRFQGGLPLGQIIATARLVNVKPTQPYDDDEAFLETDECAFGDYTPGRFAWLLDDVAALPVPIPCRGALGLWEVPAQIDEAVALEMSLQSPMRSER